jgi:hypothetical protein
MKPVKIFILRAFLILLGLLIFNCFIFSQNKFDIGVGTGLPEFPNIKIRYGNNLQAGISKSFHPVLLFLDVHLTPLEFELYYHFAGKKRDEQRPFYLLGNYGIYETSKWSPHYRCFCLRLGRSFIGRRLCMNLDIGPAFPNKGFEEYLIGTVFPSGSINFYFRL